MKHLVQENLGFPNEKENLCATYKYAHKKLSVANFLDE
ncbi:hypothetical protein L323_13885 [Ruminiclostridium papyrosolvens C7]|uniref:Uncharacterized protein n=1 Tax=Ruminiclostridium papyrosolvens C7 TaxID=1330534 RepID=U4R0D9_9FIRM|nr:hypothetical protein L323_13885 [Ruminiclostridium papyrosolvens C7]